jgi:hypothetical protein
MLETQMRAWAEVSLKNIEHNYREIRRNLPEGCRFLGVVKADAYGHGAVEVSRRLAAAGADYLGVACLSEAEQLRREGIRLPILILGIRRRSLPTGSRSWSSRRPWKRRTGTGPRGKPRPREDAEDPFKARYRDGPPGFPRGG